jgi:UDPglucose 6-dehydrogenase
MARADELGARQALEFLREIDSINLRARTRMIELVRADLGEDLSGRRIAVLGAAFKPESDDVRDSPALDIAVQLHGAGAKVRVHDPKAIANAKVRFPSLHFAEGIDETLEDAEIILHLTEWREYRELDPISLATRVKKRNIIDGRNALDRTRWIEAGWNFRALGVGR